jgi:hypothetical protein
VTGHLLHSHARDAARHASGRIGKADALGNLGIIEGRLGHLDRGTSQVKQGLRVICAIGNRAAQPGVLAALGGIGRRQGHRERAARHYRQSLALSRELGDPVLEAKARSELGQALLVAGQPADAARSTPPRSASRRG